MTQQYEMNFYIAAMQCIQDLGAATIRLLIDRFGNPYKAWCALGDRDKVDTISAIPEHRKNAICKSANDRTLTNLYAALRHYHIGYVTYLDVLFPARLQEKYNPPAVLFVKGNIELLKKSERIIAMVGARKCTDYARNVAKHFGKSFANYGVIIVSGGARGIDSASHEGALLGHGHTIAVMGCGLEQTYPPENKKLFNQIIDQKGLLVSEYPPFMPPHAKNFPARNRIISGLSQAVIVVEARASSGSLTTADMSINSGREVYVVPGNVLEHYADGCHWLLRQGAHVLTKPEDIMEDFGWAMTKDIKDSDISKSSMLSFSLEESNLIKAIPTNRAISINELYQDTRIPMDKIYSLLLELEMKQIVEKIPSRGYILCQNRSDVLVH